MGWRFRKSVNLGAGFRINLSKSGIGYSWGTKGYRITKTAKNTIRETYSIPGSGISYVKESPAKENSESNYYDAQQISNENIEAMSAQGFEEILSAAKKAITANKTISILWIISFFAGVIFPPLFLIFALVSIIKLIIQTKGTVFLEYSIDEYQTDLIAKRSETILKVMQSDKVWRITRSSQVKDTKYSGGASTTVNRVLCKKIKKLPFPFKTNISVPCLKTNNEFLIFLPDKLLVMKNWKIGALNYESISTSLYTTRFRESQVIPKDAKVVGETWQYVNKSGGPDKRFKNNRKIPICLYGEWELTSKEGLHTIIMFSNSEGI